VPKSAAIAMINDQKRQLITDLQSQGLKLVANSTGAAGRKGGAGPSDHQAVKIDGTTVMIPVHTSSAAKSNYSLTDFHKQSVNYKKSYVLEKNGEGITSIQFPHQPKFYSLKTAEGIPYNHIALLHSHNVLATTVLQTCIRYSNQPTACQFCAIEQSLNTGKTIAQKTPAQLAEVAEAAVRLDGIEQLVMTTGTPNTTDRGAAYLIECAKAVKAKVDLPIQAQCEPPDDFIWFKRMKAWGIDSLGMHIEAIEPKVRDRIMPGKAKVSLEYYFEAFEAAVKVFGWGQVSTYILAGLGDSLETITDTCDRLIQLGVYPFVVPFVPITGTPLADHQPPSSEFMYGIYERVGGMLNHAGMSSQEMKAGCAKCGACSALSTFEK
jgi:radical SAM protein (TIGR04043 family)